MANRQNGLAAPQKAFNSLIQNVSLPLALLDGCLMAPVFWRPKREA